MAQSSSAPDLSRLSIDRTAIVRPRRRRRVVWGVLLLIVAAAVAYALLRPRPVIVDTAAVVTTFPSQQFVVLNATGYVVPQRKAAIGSKATGRLEWLGVAEGSTVKAGEILARLDARDVQAQAQSAAANVNAARAALAQAEADARDAAQQFQRNRELAAKGFVAAAALDSAKARVDRSNAAVANARAAIAASEAASRNAQVSVDFTVIRAPFDGVILSKNANVGDMLTPFSSAQESKGAVVTMADMSTLEVEADVSEANVGKVRVGQPCEITLEALPDMRFRGHISRMVPTVDRAKATVMTKVRFDALDPRVLPEMSAKVAFLSREIAPTEQQPVMAVAPDAVVERSGRAVVFVVRGELAVEVPVEQGARIGDLVAITGNVKTGERVVLRAPARLASGAAVQLARK